MGTDRSIQTDSSGGLLLGIEGGGTRCTAALGNAAGQVLRKIELGPANLRLLTDRQIQQLFKTISAAFPKPAAIGIGLAGLRRESDHARVAAIVKKIWPKTPFRATHDLELALLAAPRPRADSGAQILVLSGTGSCCYGRSSAGMTRKMGGWGHILGDKGSGYEIGLRALKACVFYYDRDETWSRLGARLLRALALNEPEDLIDWVQNASKAEIAALAPEVFEAARERDKIARDILEAAANSLGKDALSLAKRLAPTQPIEVVFAGSVFTNQPGFARQVFGLIRKERADARCIVLKEPTIRGALKLAFQALAPSGMAGLAKPELSPSSEPPVSLSKSPTEQRNPRSEQLDRLSIAQAIRLMLSEEALVSQALEHHTSEIERVIGWIVAAFRKGGRLFYAGAGTSGRLGVLDASECPPTFSIPADQVQGIMAGGQRALWHGIEGAEDDFGAGERALKLRGVRKEDVVVGIAASGRTPFVWGALAAGQKIKARTVLVCFNPSVIVPREYKPDLVLAVDVGPEVLTGSTRLKAGTATKLLLNMFTTLSMVRLGKVVSNLMVDLNASNVKLRDRAIRIVCDLALCPREQSQAALERTRWQIKPALELLTAARRAAINANC